VTDIPLGQIFITGITMGLIYIMVALGLTLVFGVMRIVNFVHGEFMMLAAFSMYYLYGVWHMNFVLAFLVSAAAVSLVGIVFQRYLYRPLKYDMDNVMIAALGASFAIRSAGWIGFGPVPRHIRTVFPGMMQVFGAYLSKERAAAALVCIALTIGLYLLLHKTKTGKAIRAVEQDSGAAQVLGVSIDRVNAIVFVIGCSLATVAGTFSGILFAVEPEMGGDPLMKCFMIILIGGIGSIPGAIVAGLFLGLVDSFSETVFSGEVAFIIGFALLMLILIVRPKGLFGYDISELSTKREE
jgi:branched-chain amino acid transport system permease protein